MKNNTFIQNKNQQISTLTELNDALENYFSNTIIPQLFVDSEFILRKFTPPAMKQFRLQHSNIGASIYDVKDNFRFPSFIDNIKQVIESDEALEKEIQTTDMNWYQMNILPYRVAKEKRTDGVIITFVDITSRIRDLKEQERLVLEYELLLDTISHDVKTPLTSLSLTVEMLKKLPERGMDKFPTLMDKMESGLSKIKDIILDLTNSRDSEEHYQAASELLDIEQILEDVRLSLAPQIMEAGAVIKWEINHSEIQFVRRKLRSVLYNLVSNSIKYRDAHRALQVVIKSYLENDYIIISVEDNGRGIAESNLKTVFNKYERIATDVEGTGVGLHLVKEIVHLSGGKIEVYSKLNKGTIFKLSFKNLSKSDPSNKL